MYIVLLKLSTHRDRARELMPAHDAWIRRGLDDGAFLLVGSLQPKLGGAILARAADRAALDARLADDPFVAHDVVRPEVLEVAPAAADPRLAFLLA